MHYNAFPNLFLFGDVIRDRLQKATHRFLVFCRHAPIALDQYFLILAQAPHRRRSSFACDDIQNVKTHGIQGFQIARIGATFVSLVASLGVSSYAAYLSHFLLFEAEPNPFFAQAFARTHLRDFSR